MVIKEAKNVKGSVTISGAKNAAIPILCTSLLFKGKLRITNVPQITDVFEVLNILKYLNSKILIKGNEVFLDNSLINYKPLTLSEVSHIRGSYYFIPIFIHLFGKCEIIYPGGCQIGTRSLDAHFDVFEKMGFEVLKQDNMLVVTKSMTIKKFKYTMTKNSVGASINAILSALYCDYAIIDELTLEPEALNLIEFLQKIGFNINAINGRCVIKKSEIIPSSVRFTIIPDRMEAITYTLLGLLTGKVVVKNIVVNHLKFPLELLISNHYNVVIKKNKLIAKKSRGNSFDITTDIYPLFPTDMQPLFGVLLALSRGTAKIEEKIFDHRMQIYHDLNQMGAHINVIGNKAYVIGNETLKPIVSYAHDLRHGAALILANTIAKGQIENIEIVSRGYDSFLTKLKKLGVKYKIKEKRTCNP